MFGWKKMNGGKVNFPEDDMNEVPFEFMPLNAIKKIAPSADRSTNNDRANFLVPNTSCRRKIYKPQDKRYLMDITNVNDPRYEVTGVHKVWRKGENVQTPVKSRIIAWNAWKREGPGPSLVSGQKTDSSSSSSSPAENDTRYGQKVQKTFRLFTGSIENLYLWYNLKVKNDFALMFELIATVESIENGQWKSEKILLLSDSKSGPNIQVYYYEIDRPLPKVLIGSNVLCVGRLITQNRFQAFKLSKIASEDKSNIQRMSYLCNRIADEVIGNKLKFQI